MAKITKHEGKSELIEKWRRAYANAKFKTPTNTSPEYQRAMEDLDEYNSRIREEENLS